MGGEGRGTRKSGGRGNHKPDILYEENLFSIRGKRNRREKPDV